MSRCDIDGDHDWEAQWVCEDCGERKAFDFEQEAYLAQKLAQARAALKEYGQHADRCRSRYAGLAGGSVLDGLQPAPCDCGFAAALAEPRPCGCVATIHAPQCPYGGAEQEGQE